jgi:hypothetical protein
MKTLNFFLLAILTILFLQQNNISAQVQINMDVTPLEIAEHFIGPGIFAFDNVTFQGPWVSKGLFSGADSTLLGTESGFFLTSGTGFFIPGPNLSGITGSNNGAPGSAVLNSIATQTTFDAAVLEFDIMPVNDTLKFNYSFGSEEYNEQVGMSYYDVCGAFISGPNPAGGFYTNKNIMTVPGTTNTNVSINSINNGNAPAGVIPTGPCTNCWYFLDNTGGLDMEYDGFTTKLLCRISVIPFEEYHIFLGVADVGGGGKDSGIFIEEHSLFSPGAAEFTSFNFYADINPALPWDVTGIINDSSVYLEVPADVDVSNLIASYTESGAYVSLNGVTQTSGATANDFTDTLIYQLQSHEIKDWTVIVELVTDVPEVYFDRVIISPNPAKGKIVLKHINGINIKICDSQGKAVTEVKSLENFSTLVSGELSPGIYFIELEKDGYKQTRKVIVN